MNSANRLPLVDPQRRTRASDVDLRLRDGEPDKARHASRNDLVFKHVFCFPVELLRDFVDTRGLLRVCSRFGFPKQAANCLDDERRSVLREVIDSSDELVGKGYLNGHAWEA